MPTSNLYLVTRSIQRLLELNVAELLRREQLPPTITVTSMPPERAMGMQNTLNVHLYHLMEDSYYKNETVPGHGGVPVARQSLVVSLFYILTAHHEVNTVFDAEIQQLIFGLAMKSIHDHPVIDDHLMLPGAGGVDETVIDPGLVGDGNRIELSLRPITPEESMSFWSAEQVSTTRLSAYYEARTIFVEPEGPVGSRGPAYDLGLYVSAGQAPVLNRVSALSRFTPPAQAGVPEQTIETSPARVTLAIGLNPPVNRVVLVGNALTGTQPGDARIVLRTPAWRELASPIRSAPIDTALNPDWDVSIDAARAQFDMLAVLTIDDGSGGQIDLEVTPGIYAASVEITRRQQSPSGTTRTSTLESNQVAFPVGARIDGFDAPNAAGRMVIRIVNLFDFEAPSLEVTLAVDGLQYTETNAFTGVAADDEGHFVRQAGQLEFHPLFNPTVQGVRPVRLVVNSAESQPFWIEIT